MNPRMPFSAARRHESLARRVCTAPLALLLAPEHECLTARQQGWEAISTGEILSLAEGEFHVFLTADQNIRYQQKLTGRSIAILELSTNNLRRIEASIGMVKVVLSDLKAGDLRLLEIPWLYDQPSSPRRSARN